MSIQSMMASRSLRRRRMIAVIVILCVVAGLAWIGVSQKRFTPTFSTSNARQAAGAQALPDRPVPVVEPLVLDTSNPDEARKRNAEIPFSTDPNPAARPFKFTGDMTALARATDCLAAAMVYEAGDDGVGELAVGQVVLNRVRHPAFPKTVCDVVFQGQERATGCQFTFTCDGAMARQPSPAAWMRARGLASGLLAGAVFRPVGYSTHYHTNWVIPYWSETLDKVTAIDTHLFFRWKGWWGTPGAFASKVVITAEPAVAKLIPLSPIHNPGNLDALLVQNGGTGLLIDDKMPMMAIGADMIGKHIGPGKLTAIEPGGNGFVMTIDKGGDPARYAEAAAKICAGRAQCRLLAWTNPGATPRAFPVADGALGSMSFSYIRMKESGFERMLYNCDEFPAAPRSQCMAKRIPVGPPPPKLIADDQRIKLPESGRPIADTQGGRLEVAPHKLELKPRETPGTP